MLLKSMWPGLMEGSKKVLDLQEGDTDPTLTP